MSFGMANARQSMIEPVVEHLPEGPTNRSFGYTVGGILIGVLENLSAGFLDARLGGGVREVAPYVFLVIILLVKPYGLFGRERIERV